MFSLCSFGGRGAGEGYARCWPAGRIADADVHVPTCVWKTFTPLSTALLDLYAHSCVGCAGSFRRGSLPPSFPPSVCVCVTRSPPSSPTPLHRQTSAGVPRHIPRVPPVRLSPTPCCALQHSSHVLTHTHTNTRVRPSNHKTKRRETPSGETARDQGTVGGSGRRNKCTACTHSRCSHPFSPSRPSFRSRHASRTCAEEGMSE